MAEQQQNQKNGLQENKNRQNKWLQGNRTSICRRQALRQALRPAGCSLQPSEPMPRLRHLHAHCTPSLPPQHLHPLLAFDRRALSPQVVHEPRRIDLVVDIVAPKTSWTFK
jgi:hypothetical protein